MESKSWFRKLWRPLFTAISLLLSSSGPGWAQEPVQQNGFRVERLPIPGGAELLTIFGRPLEPANSENDAGEIPLVSVLRDTLGDDVPENDRLRYVWAFSYTRPSLTQRAAASVPFFYGRAGNKKAAENEAPPPILDLGAPNRSTWHRLVWNALQNFFLDQQGFAVRATTRAHHRNARDYHKAHVVRALAILSLIEPEGDRVAFSHDELNEIQARLVLAEKTLGVFVDDIYLQRAYQRHKTRTLDIRGHNWELLRQRAEAEGLYFEPLSLPDGNTTHAILWVAKEDLAQHEGRRFNSRFLNIRNPWSDSQLRNWTGYVEKRYLDAENRMVHAATAGAKEIDLIPLALYGLDHPHIPILLVDFRSGLNPKLRETYRRATGDLLRNVYEVSRFSDLRYFMARAIFNFIVGRRGTDINQPSRLQAYSELKLLLTLSETINPRLKEELSRQLEAVSLNPMENDVPVETELARTQYAALKAYASRPDGLPRLLDRDRRTEMTPVAHNRAEQVLLKVANVATFGLYKHREAPSPALAEKLAVRRSLSFHQRFLREVVKSTPRIEVVWDMERVRASLRFVADNSQEAGSDAARLAALVFSRTADEETRRLCLVSLYRIDREAAKSALLRLYRDESIEPRWRAECADYLRSALRQQHRIAGPDAREIVTRIGL